MKKILLAVMMSVLLSACDDGSAFTTPTMKADEVTRIEAIGNDLRVYEFTPLTNSNKQCVFVSGESKAAMDCWTKVDL